MEAKVDVRKLQLLNDRVSQMIDALNQVRMSVYGLSHTGLNPMLPAGLNPGFPPFGITGYGYQPYGFGLPVPIGIPGLQHTPALGPLGTPTPSFLPGTQPAGLPPFLPPFFGAPTPWYQGYPLGISHTSPELFEHRLMELKANDPIRLAQTFPFFFTHQPGLVW